MSVRTFFLFLLLAICPWGLGFAQINMYYEDFDGVTPPALPPGWSSNTPTTQTMDNTPSSSYSGASGKQNLFLANCIPLGEYREVLLEGVSTLGHTGIKIRFGHRRTAAFTPPITLEWSADGTNWNVISDYNSNSAGTTLWTAYQSSTLPSGADNQTNLRFRWSWETNFNNDCMSGTPNYRMDDVSVTAEMALPVELLSFTARHIGRHTLLEWSTATETDNDYFGIERSPDGQRFETIGRVEGAGTTQTQRDYAFTDHAPLPGFAYYRLRQTNYDGSVAYSPIVSVWAGNLRVHIAPMPVRDLAYLTFENSTEQPTNWRLYGADGRLIRAGTAPQGAARYALDMSDLASGFYFLRIEQAGWAMSERVWKQ